MASLASAAAARYVDDMRDVGVVSRPRRAAHRVTHQVRAPPQNRARDPRRTHVFGAPAAPGVRARHFRRASSSGVASRSHAQPEGRTLTSSESGRERFGVMPAATAAERAANASRSQAGAERAHALDFGGLDRRRAQGLQARAGHAARSSGNVPPDARRGLTRYLAVRTIDRYLAAATVSRAELQLVGVASLLLAFKHEELLAPKLSDLADIGAEVIPRRASRKRRQTSANLPRRSSQRLTSAQVYITDKAYSETRILEAEAAMAKALGYRLAGPTVLTFLARYLKAGGARPRG